MSVLVTCRGEELGREGSSHGPTQVSYMFGTGCRCSPPFFDPDGNTGVLGRPVAEGHLEKEGTGSSSRTGLGPLPILLISLDKRVSFSKKGVLEGKNGEFDTKRKKIKKGKD